MNITDDEMADTLGRTKLQIEDLKKLNEAQYNVLKTGILCKKLNLNEKDLQKIYDDKLATCNNS